MLSTHRKYVGVPVFDGGKGALKNTLGYCESNVAVTLATMELKSARFTVGSALGEGDSDGDGDGVDDADGDGDGDGIGLGGP